MDRTLLAELAYRFLAGTATEEEKTLLHQWFDAADKEEIELVFTRERETDEDVRKRIFTGLQTAIGQEPAEELAAVGPMPVEGTPVGPMPVEGTAVGPMPVESTPVGPMPLEGSPIELEPAELEPVEPEPRQASRRIWRYTGWVAAASILVVVGVTGLYFWNTRKAGKAVSSSAPVASVRKDLPPGGNRATLVLGDGSVVNLAAAQNGVIRKVAGTTINKHDGQLVYSVSRMASPSSSVGALAAAPEMNTIQTPRGGQYRVVLPDGTEVWLNAASSLTYPTVFSGPERQVRLNGEAYFEVARKKDQPFVVAAGNMQVNVLGTHFNLMAYDDENTIKTTLLEGAVKVTKGDASYLLQPGQQASLDRSSGSFKLLAVNVDEVVAWKNGVFELGGETIEPVMREMARWYDVDVEYQGKTSEHFRGTIPRSVDASEVFKMLELTGAVHFTIEGKKVIVRP
ncbi:MAG TPA: FecR domain-containing protein [Puia sp.]|nr:FecR domain-containing protein [Puia sp.]